MSHPRPRARFVPWLNILSLAALAVLLRPSIGRADDEGLRYMPVSKAIPRDRSAAGAFGTANSNCGTSACDTVWVGHNSSGPGGPFLGVGVGGVWDFDTGVAGTDSTQGWTRQLRRYHFTQSRPVASRPEWYLDYGNMVNEGNTNLWASRDLAGRKYVKTGIAGVWHSDTMVGVKQNVSNGAEPSATAISGTRSAWCGLREAGNLSAQDALTGNYINGDLYDDQGAPYAVLNEPEFPGYCSQWDQMLYKDFSVAGSGSLSFKVRTNMSPALDTATNGSGWYNPDPTSFANYVHQPADSFMVYVGSPNDAAYDTNRRWFSEVLDLSQPHQELLAVGGVYPIVSPDTALTIPYAGITPVAGKIRVVFRVKTNRFRADGQVGTTTAFNTKDGAAVLDDVSVNGGTVYGFETAGSVTARSLIPDLSANGGAWATTGKPPSLFMRIANVSTLIYEDLCGAVGAPTRNCNLTGNVLLAGDADNANTVPIETWQQFESPTINLAVRNAAPGTKNAQGIDQETASRKSGYIEFDWYTGFANPFDQSVFIFVGAKCYQPSLFKQPVSQTPIWSRILEASTISFNNDPLCFTTGETFAALGVPVGSIDSLRVTMNVQTLGFAFGGSDLGNTRGTYFDNIRVGFIRGEAPALAWDLWGKLQDQFPVNESVAPGDNASFDTTTAHMTIGLNNITPGTDRGAVAGDSLYVDAPYTGDGIATGTRVDLIFRIDPGPGNYTVKGDRSSSLVNKDPARPFFATYLANNGQFGTPGGHAGGVWNRNVWNSARMDSAEANLYPIVPRSISGPQPPTWQGTLHESDPNFATLGITHNVCFMVNPAGAQDQTNIDCSGAVPAPYGAVSGTTKEGTKIIPDGWFTPGTHIEYFARRCTIEDPGSFTMEPDTNTVLPQNDSFDAERWWAVDVLPDMWKSTRFSGSGLACLLMVDAADRRGFDPSFRGAADTLGYGKNNGASQGWKGKGPAASSADQANDPSAFVAANLGQYGLNFDHFDITGSEGVEGGRLGSRFANNLGLVALKGDMAGPSAAQLASLYNGVVFSTGDLSSSTLADGFDAQEGSNDIALLEGFLNSGTPANRKMVWLSGEGIMEDGALNSDDGTHLYPFLTDVFGADLTSNNYKAFSGDQVSQTVGFLPTAPWAHPGRTYGMNHSCFVLNDVLATVPTVDGAAEAAQYQHLGPGPYTASVYRPNGAGRDFRTLLDGFALSYLKGNYADIPSIATKAETDIGRIAWFDDVWAGHFQLCARRGPVIGVGDLPGSGGGRFTNRNLGSFPNPSFAGRDITLRFTLAKAQDVTVRIFNVAGREVAHLVKKGVAGPNSVVWNGATSNGAHAMPGVYFYMLDGIDFEKGGSKAQKMILLGANTE